MATLFWNTCEEIPHIHGKRNPSKTVSVVRGHHVTEKHYETLGEKTESSVKSMGEVTSLCGNFNLNNFLIPNKIICIWSKN